MTKEKLEELKRDEQIEKAMRNDIDYCAERCNIDNVVEAIAEFEKKMKHYGWTFANDQDLCDYILLWR